MIIPYLVVALGGSLGAIFRYATVLGAQNVLGMQFPYGTLIVNTFGSLLAGFFLALFVERFSGGEYWRLFFFVGFLGAYTTFSSFAAESWFLIEQAQWGKLLINIIANNVGSLVMVYVGFLLARYLVLGSVEQT